MPSKSVAVRVFSSKEDAENWQDHPINSFLPLFLGAEGNIDNINKRIRMLYLKSPAIIKVRWHFKEDESTGYWVDRDAD